jgi:PAS domain S-box-containing protein
MRATLPMRPTSADSNYQPRTQFKVFGWLALTLATVGLMVNTAVRNNARQANHRAAVAQRHAFIAETEAILSSLHAAEAAQRTFLLTGDQSMKNAASEYFAKVDSHLKAATKMSLENPEQLNRLGPISDLLDTRMEANKESQRLLAQTSIAAAAGVFTNAQARANLRELERQVTANRMAENKLILEREETAQRHNRWTDQILYAGIVLDVILLGLAIYGLRIDLRWSRAATAALETKIREHTAELNAAYEKLQVENIEQQWGQAALQRVVDHHELVVNSIREGIFVVSKHGRIISANPAAADLTRREARQLAGKSIGTVLLDGDRLPYPWERHFLRTALKHGATVPPKTATVKQADGSLVDVQIACYPTRDRENLTGAVITVAYSATQYSA